MQTEKKGNRIAVLIPCYNEALTIGNVVRDYRQALPDADIYVYDNNSTDETARLAREAGAIVRPEPRQGKGNVVRTMFRDIEADCYLMVDGDDTYPASQAAALCAPVLEGRADMVIGDRLSSTYFTENKRPFHNCGNMLVRRCINMFWKRGRQIEDVMTGMRAMSPLFVKSFPILSQGFEIETEMTIFSLANNFRIASMPIQYRDRPEGSFSKLSTFRDGFRVLKTIAVLFKDYRPLLVFWSVACLLALLSLGLFLPVLGEYMAKRARTPLPDPDRVRILHAGGFAELCCRPDPGLPAQAGPAGLRDPAQCAVTAAAAGQDRHALRREQAGARPSGVNEESRATARLFPFGTTLERTQRKGWGASLPGQLRALRFMM